MFRIIPGYPDYRVNCFGVVQSRKLSGSRIGTTGPWHTLKQQVTRQGYFTVMVSILGPQRRVGVHRLVAWAFHGHQPAGFDVRHLDGNNKNNFANNLKYGTKAENMEDAIKHGDLGVGEKSHCAKLTNEQVLEIRRMAAAGMRHRLIGEQFGVGRHYIARIACREIWKHI